MSSIKNSLVIGVFLVSAFLVEKGLAAGAKMRTQASFIRVSVTSQTYNFINPWDKHGPGTKIGIGAILKGGRILVSARLVANSTFVELEKIENGEKCPASVLQIDYSSDLALLSPSDPNYLQNQRGIKVSRKKLKVGDRLNFWQFENNGTPLIGNGELKGIEVSHYPFKISSRLVFIAKVLLSEVGSSYTLPITRKGKLVGILMSHKAETQRATLIPSPVINHFLDDLDDGSYDGFPQGAFLVSKLEDPQLRNYLGLGKNEVGVFVDKVRPGGPADIAGLKAGDVLLGIDEFLVDDSAQYVDPDYGKLAIAHLTTTRSFAGDTRTFYLLRDQEEKFVNVTLEPLKLENYPVPPLVLDQPPEYFVVGGMVFQELSKQYLTAWGSNWKASVPRRLLHYHRYQWDLVPTGEKVVFLSKILPSQANEGYGGFLYGILESINKISIKKLKDIPVALEKPSEGFHHFEFVYDPKYLYLDALSLASENKRVKERYNLPKLFHFN